MDYIIFRPYILPPFRQLPTLPIEKSASDKLIIIMIIIRSHGRDHICGWFQGGEGSSDRYYAHEISFKNREKYCYFCT